VPRGGGDASPPRDDGEPRATSRDSDSGRFAVPRNDSHDEAVRRPPARSHRSGSHHRGRRAFASGGWCDPWYSGPGRGGGWGWGWGGWWGPWGPAGVYYDGPYRRGGRGSGYGALDLDVWPGDAEIYVDGNRVGSADDFDGFPSYLWLPRGTYDVVIYLPGFQTIARQYSVYDGLVIDVEDRMERGQAVRPEDLPAKTHDRRDERLRNEAEIQERARRRDEWRQRQAEADMAPPAEAAPGVADTKGTGAAPERDSGSAARVHLVVVPRDASVYLDGNFIGTGAELVQLSAGVVVTPGSHRLEVVRPGYEAKEIDFESTPGEEVRLQVELDED